MKPAALVIACLALLGACTARPAPDASLGGPKLDLERYFDGRVVAYGQFQDILGEVRRRFTVEIEGVWDGETLTLTEDFVYEDGSTERRVWSLVKTGEDTWRGTAPGVIGEAVGVERAETFNWRYTIDLPVPDGTLRVSFDDWMWLVDERRLINRAYMTRLGIDIGDVIIFFEKQAETADPA
ncbi:MAG: DUF3833 domain-containing protein [Pseudomonadota bacterium]